MEEESMIKYKNIKSWPYCLQQEILATRHMKMSGATVYLTQVFTCVWQPLSRSYVIKTQHKNNAMLVPNLTC